MNELEMKLTDIDDDAANPKLPAALTSEMSRLFNAGFSLISLGGNDGKKSTLKFANSGRLPLRVVVDRMAGGGSQTYGIRTSGLLVDVDTDTAEARRYVEERFGSSTARTRTPRGVHHYFRHVGKKPRDVQLPNIKIEFKSGDNEYVAGPESRRPDGGVYVAEAPLTSHKDLPWFVDRHASPGRDKNEQLAAAGFGDQVQGKGSIQRGFRHTALKQRARQLALVAESLPELITDLIAFREWEIDQPDDFPDAMVTDLAAWFWDRREAGTLWGAKNSGVFIHRHPIDELARLGEPLALLVYNVVVSAHGHKRDKEFALSPDGLRKSGRVKAGREQLYTAIHLLVQLKLLVRRSRPQGKRVFYVYKLGAPWLNREGGEGSFLTLVPETGTPAAARRTKARVA